jgi:hypothetical protein
MTASQSGKSARYARCLSTGHGKARSDIKLKSQVARQFAAFDATCRSSISRCIVSQLAASLDPNRTLRPAALKSP